jgi:argininosuccinate lyase
MYRSRSTEKLKDDVLKFLSSMDQDHSILHYDILGSEAHSIMLHEKGHITDIELKRILSALEEAKKSPTHIKTEEYEDIHEALEAFVIQRSGMEGRKNDRADFSSEVFNQCLEHFKMDEDLMVNLKAAIIYLEHYKIIHRF